MKFEKRREKFTDKIYNKYTLPNIYYTNFPNRKVHIIFSLIFFKRYQFIINI